MEFFYLTQMLSEVEHPGVKGLFTDEKELNSYETQWNSQIFGPAYFEVMC
jgi:hypothetical protein